MDALTSKCRKFEANIFNKSKCQNCFKGKEDHSAEALESNRNSRKVIQCGYLFVAPESFNFTNQNDRSKRWQRRFFILYDDGELSYSVDDNVSTVPQGVIDMNQCSEVFSAQDSTGHQYSIGITSLDRVTYVKGSSKDEINRWQDLFSVYPRSVKSQPRPRTRPPPSPNTTTAQDHQPPQGVNGILSSSSNSTYASMNNKTTENDNRLFHSVRPLFAPSATSIRDVATEPRTTSYVLTGSQQPNRKMEMERPGSGPARKETVAEKAPQTYRGVRSMKHRNDRAYADNLRKSNSLQNLQSVRGVGERYPTEPTGRSSSTDRNPKQRTVTVGAFSASSPASPHGSHLSLTSMMTNTDACPPVTPGRRSETDPFGWDRTDSRVMVLPRRKSSTSMELEKFSNTNIVSSTAMFWEQMAVSDVDATSTTWPRSESRTPTAEGVPRSRHASNSPLRNRKPAQNVARSRVRSRTVAVDQRRISTDSSTDGWESNTGRTWRKSGGERLFPTTMTRVGTSAGFRGLSRNETDEFKISKGSPEVGSRNSEAVSRTPKAEIPPIVGINDLMYVKKGWLLRQSVDKSWQKCWCVLSNNALTYYSDSKKVETLENVEGVIILTADTEVEELNVPRSFAFRISNKANEYVLSAMTSGIRTSWIQATARCVDAFTDAVTSHDLTLSSLDSVATTLTSWKSLPAASDSDADFDLASKDSTSSWSSYHTVPPPLRSAPPIPTSTPDRSRSRTTSTWPYRPATTFAGHGSTAADSANRDDRDLPDRGRQTGTSIRASGENELSYVAPHSRSSTTEVGPTNQSSILDTTDGSFHVVTRRNYVGSNSASDRKNDPPETRSDRDDQSAKRELSTGSQFRAPSSRILERARAKSPKRVKSPPPLSAPAVSASVPCLGPEELELPEDVGRRHSTDNWTSDSLPRGSSDSSLLDLMKCEVAALRQQLDATRSQLEDAQSANAALRSKLSKSSQEIQKMTEISEIDKRDYHLQVNRLQTHLSETSGLVESQNMELLELRKKNQQLSERDRNKLELERLEMESLNRELSDRAGAVAKLEAEVKLCRRELRTKEAEVEALERSWKDRYEGSKARWNSERNVLEKRVEKLESQLNESAEVSSVETKNVANVLKDRESALSLTETRLAEVERKLQSTLNELELEMEDNTRIHKELDEYCKEAAELRMRLAASEERSAGREADVRHLQEEKQALVTLTAERDTKNALLRRDVDRVEGQLREVTDENVRLKEEVKVGREVMEKLRSELDVKTRELERLRVEVDRQVEAMKKRSDEADEKRAAAEARVLQLHSKMADVEKKSSGAQGLSVSEFEQIKAKNDKLRVELESARKMVESLEEERETERLKSREAVVEKEKRILQLQCEYGELIEQQKVAKRELAQSVSKNAELKGQLTSAKTDLESELRSKEAQMKEYESKLKTLQREVETRKTVEATERKAEDAELGEKNASMSRQLKQLQVEKQQADARCGEMEEATKLLKQEQRNAEVSHAEEVERLGAKVQELTTKISQLERRNRRLEQRSKSEDDGGRSDEAITDAAGTESGSKLGTPGGTAEQLRKENDNLSLENRRLLEQLQTTKLGYGSDASKTGLDEAEKEDYIAQIAEQEEALVVAEKDLEELQSELARAETSRARDIQALRDGYEIRIRSLEHDLSAGRHDFARSMLEQDKDLSDYERELSQKETELDELRAKSARDVDLLGELGLYKEQALRLENELKEVYAELEGRRSSATEDWSGGQAAEALRMEVDQLRKMLKEEQKRHMMDMTELRNDPSVDVDRIDAHLRIKELEEQIDNMKSDYEHELQMQKASHRRELMNSKDDVMQKLAAAEANSIPIDEESVRRKYTKELEQIRDMYDKGFNSMEKSHQRTMMEMRRNQKMELDRLRQEKDQLLKEEAQATQAALEAMRKAHETELQKERNKFLDLIAKTFSHADMETLQRQHEEDAELLHYEMKQLSERFSIKCLENAALAERLESLTKSLHESRKRVQDLLSRNDELNSQLKFKVERLGRAVGLPMTRVDSESKETTIVERSQDLNSAEVKLQIKQMEAIHLHEELENTKLELNMKIEELKESTEKYHELCEEFRLAKRKPSSDRGVDGSDLLSLLPLHARTSSASSKRSVGDSIDLLNLTLEDNMMEGLDEEESSQRDDSRSSSQLEGGGFDAIPGRRSLWRFKNPQRARSNPSDSKLPTFQKSLSVDSDRTLPQIPPKDSLDPLSARSTYDDDDPETTELIQL